MSNRERTIESKGRIEFIDLAKGICILLVVMIHVGVPEYIPGLYAAKVPIFFLLSGLFFLKKVNFFLRGGYWNKLCTTIVIPFLAYYLISYAMFYVIDRVIPNVLGGKQDFSIIDVFRQRNLFNGPLWFLICLAEVEALLYVVWKCIRTNMMKCAFISSLAILGFLLASYKIFIPMWLDTAMVASLFFYFGILISETNFLIKGTKSLYLVLGAVICYLIYIFFPVKISMSVNYYSNR